MTVWVILFNSMVENLFGGVLVELVLTKLVRMGSPFEAGPVYCIKLCITSFVILFCILPILGN